MVTGLTPMDSIYSGYGMQNFYNNPYFLQAYNSPNFNQMQAMQQMQTQQQMLAQQSANLAGQTPTQANLQVSNGANINFQGAQSAISGEAKEEKGGNGLAWFLGLTTTAIGAAWWLSSRGKARNATGLWNQIKLGFTSLFNKPTVIKGADIVKHKDALKLNDALKWTDDAAKLNGFQFELKNPEGILNRVTVRNGELVGLADLTQKATKENNLRNITKLYKDNKLSDAFKKQIDDVIEAVGKKDVSSLSKDINLKNIVYSGAVEQGSATYLANALKPEMNGVKLVNYYPA